MFDGCYDTVLLVGKPEHLETCRVCRVSLGGVRSGSQKRKDGRAERQAARPRLERHRIKVDLEGSQKADLSQATAFIEQMTSIALFIGRGHISESHAADVS